MNAIGKKLSNLNKKYKYAFGKFLKKVYYAFGNWKPRPSAIVLKKHAFGKKSRPSAIV